MKVTLLIVALLACLAAAPRGDPEMRKRIDEAQKRLQERQRQRERQATTQPTKPAAKPAARAAMPPAEPPAVDLVKLVAATVEKTNAAVAKPLPANATTAQKEFAAEHRRRLVQAASDALMGVSVTAELPVQDVVRASDAGFKGPKGGLAAKSSFDLPLSLPAGIQKEEWRPRLLVFYRGADADLLQWAKDEVHSVSATVEAVRVDGHGEGDDWKAISSLVVWVTASDAPPAEVDLHAVGRPAGPANANQRGKVVFVCDATGTMINKFELLQKELYKAVDALQPAQSFNIVFFFDGPKAASIGNLESLLPATPENKQRAIKFVSDFSTTGQTDPMPGIRLALKMQPQLLYFLSDGQFDNLVPYEQVIAHLDKLNKNRRTRINTIQFASHDKEAEEVLQKIAAQHGGSYRFVSQEDLTADAKPKVGGPRERRPLPGEKPRPSGPSIFQEH